MKVLRRLIYSTSVLFTFFLIEGLLQPLLAQNGGPPPVLPFGPAAPVPWGSPVIYAATLLGYGLYRHIRKTRGL